MVVDSIATFLVVSILMILIAVVLTLPLRLAAKAVGARRTGIAWCLIALVGAALMHAIGLSFPWAGTVVAFLLSSAAFASILGTHFLGGIGIAILHAVFSFLLLFAALAVAVAVSGFMGG